MILYSASLHSLIMHFPTQGVYANLTIQLGESISSRPLKVWGAIYACFTLMLWIFAMARTIPSVWNGSIFEAPCLEDQELSGKLIAVVAGGVEDGKVADYGRSGTGITSRYATPACQRTAKETDQEKGVAQP